MLFCMVLNWAALNDGVSIHTPDAIRPILTTS
jgi:SP family general alpha glucoside:H+ symporter-like MFS transporter